MRDQSGTMRADVAWEQLTRAAWGAPPAYVRLLEHDPDFSDAVGAHDRRDATRLTYAARAHVPTGAWAPELMPGDRPFAILVAGGLMLRDLSVGDRVTSQLIGPGDALCLRPAQDVVIQARILTPLSVLVLDARFLQAARRWPDLSLELLHRCGEWAHRALHVQAIGNLSRIDDRLLALFAHLAVRWGRVTPRGTEVELDVTHATLGRLLGAERPTVSLALKSLEHEQRLTRRDATWVLAAA